MKLVGFARRPLFYARRNGHIEVGSRGGFCAKETRTRSFLFLLLFLLLVLLLLLLLLLLLFLLLLSS